jgi:general secretion pathway protein D
MNRYSLSPRAGLLVLALTLTGCAAQRLHDEGLRRIGAGDRAGGIEQLREASQMEPGNARYRMSYVAQRDAALEATASRLSQLIQTGRIDEAEREWQQTARLAAGSEWALSVQSQLQQARDRAAAVREADRALREGQIDLASQRVEPWRAQAAQDQALRDLLHRLQQAQDTRARAEAAQRSPLQRQVSLQLRDANLKMVFEALARGNGLNIIVDKEVRSELKASIHVTDASLGDTLDLLLMQHQLARRMINANTVLVYPATPAKLREYQELHVRSFQLSNADAKQVGTVLRTLLKLREVVVDERTNSIILREAPEALEVAARVIAAQEFSDAEVMLELEVMEVSRDRLNQIGIQWPGSLSLSTPASATGALTVGTLRGLGVNDLLVNGLSASANLRAEETDTNTLASPRIRVRSREKARVMIGDRVPVITNTVTPVTTGGAVVTGSVQYLDVGLKLEIEPQVHAESDVGIKLNLEVSNIVKEIGGPNGSLAYQIGTRSAQTSLRLRDGETQILAGLISDADRASSVKVPGVGQLPFLDRLFGSQRRNLNKTEIVLAVTPRIVRPFAQTDPGQRSVVSGTEALLRATPLSVQGIGSLSIPEEGAAGVSRTTSAPAGTASRTNPAIPMPSEPTRRSSFRQPLAPKDSPDE